MTQSEPTLNPSVEPEIWPWSAPQPWEAVFPIRSLIMRLSSLSVGRQVLDPSVASAVFGDRGMDEAIARMAVLAIAIQPWAKAIAPFVPEAEYPRLFDRICIYVSRWAPEFIAIGKDPSEATAEVNSIIRYLEALEAMKYPAVSAAVSELRAQQIHDSCQLFMAASQPSGTSTGQENNRARQACVQWSNATHSTLNRLAESHQRSMHTASLTGKIPRRKMTQGEANEAAKELIREDKGFAMKQAREWAAAIGCSLGIVNKLPIWKACMEQRRKAAPPKAPKAVSLTTRLENIIDSRGKMGRNVAMTNGDGELEKLIREQQGDFEPSPMDPSERPFRPTPRRKQA